MKPKPPKPIPFLKEQQELSAMFEPEKVARYLQIAATDFQIDREVYALCGLSEVKEQFVGANITKKQLRQKLEALR